MKILKQTDLSKWEYHLDCSKCQSELLADADDVRASYYDGDYREPSSESYYITCPVCQQNMPIESVAIPALLKVQLKQKVSAAQKTTLFDPYNR